MLAEVLWPAETNMKIDRVDMEPDRLVITAHGSQTTACCPSCGAESSRINSHYRRCPADAPCGGYAIELKLTVPRFFCDNKACPRQTFAGRFPTLIAPYARRTKRLGEQQHRVGLAASAEEGARLLPSLGMRASPDTLIRLVRDVPETPRETPRVLGVDDWAKRKGRTYGTIFVDLEKHQVVDLLDDRTAESLACWLREHPGVEVISRDRGAEFKEGASRGAPEAIQIKEFQAQGWSRRAIARHLKIDPRTVSKYFAHDVYPRRMASAKSTSTVSPYMEYVTKRWQEGCQDISRLHAELNTLGFQGHYASVYRFVNRLLRNGSIPVIEQTVPISPPQLSATEAAWLLVHADDRLDETQLRLRDQLCRISDDIQAAWQMAQSFLEMVRN